MDLALKIEEKLNPSIPKSVNQKTSTQQSTSTFRTFPLTINSSSTTGEKNVEGTPSKGGNWSTAQRNVQEVRRLSEKDLQDKKAKGLCFRCDGKWQVGHRCPRRELSIILTLEGDEEEDEGCEMPVNEMATEVCLNSVMGITKPKTMKLKGTILEQEVVIMIDPGATHNFISLDTVEKLNIPVTATGGFGVALGTGVKVQGKGECRGVQLHLQGLIVTEDFLPLNLGNSDIITTRKRVTCD